MKALRTSISVVLLVVVLAFGSGLGLADGHQPSEEQMQAMMAEMAANMILEDESPHGFDETVARFEEAVDAAGWSIIGVQDMQAILADRGHDVLPISIFALCSAQYSAELLQYDDERIVSPFMPCSVSVYEKSNGSTYIARMNAPLVAEPFGGIIAEVMDKAAAETEEIIANTLK